MLSSCKQKRAADEVATGDLKRATTRVLSVFEGLPRDVLFIILGPAHNTTVSRFSMVCKRFYRCVRSKYVVPRVELTIYPKCWPYWVRDVSDMRSAIDADERDAIKTRDLCITLLERPTESSVSTVITQLLELFCGYRTLRLTTVPSIDFALQFEKLRLPFCPELLVLDTNLVGDFIALDLYDKSKLSAVFSSDSSAQRRGDLEKMPTLDGGNGDLIILGEERVSPVRISHAINSLSTNRLIVKCIGTNLTMLQFQSGPFGRVGSIHLVNGPRLAPPNQRMMPMDEFVDICTTLSSSNPTAVIYIPQVTFDWFEPTACRDFVINLHKIFCRLNLRWCVSLAFMHTLYDSASARHHSAKFNILLRTFLMFTDRSRPVLRDDADAYRVREFTDSEYAEVLDLVKCTIKKFDDEIQQKQPTLVRRQNVK